jgi:hypothetical protein
MRKRGIWSFILLLGVVAALGVAFTSAGVARADTTQYPVAGLLSDGSVYVAADDGYWHPIDMATFVKDGYTYNDVTWYGQLPGTLAPETVSSYVSFAEFVNPPVNLAGVIGSPTVYIDVGDGYWHPVTAAQFASEHYSMSWVKWFGELSGSVMPD